MNAQARLNATALNAAPKALSFDKAFAAVIKIESIADTVYGSLDKTYLGALLPDLGESLPEVALAFNRLEFLKGVYESLYDNPDVTITQTGNSTLTIDAGNAKLATSLVVGNKPSKDLAMTLKAKGQIVTINFK